MTDRRFPPPRGSPRRCWSYIASSQADSASSQHVAARSSASIVPCFVVSEVLGHVVKIFLFSDRRRFEDAFGLLDQRPSSLDFRATRVIHNPFLPVRRVVPREFRRQSFNKSLVESDLKRTDLGKSAKDSAGKGAHPMKTAAEYRVMADECFKWAREARADEVRGSLLQAGPKVDEAIRSAAWYY
jgi:hypothetical protein